MHTDTKIIIHLGMHKTGTTYLQRLVFNQKNINLITNPNYAITNWHIEQNKINILSIEALSLSMPHSKEQKRTKCDREEILDYLKKLFPDAKIILGIREKQSWLKSCYGEYIKIGGTLRYNEYVNHYEKDIINVSQYITSIKRRWENVFIYTIPNLNAQIQDICEYCEIQIPKIPETKLNKGLTKTQIKILRYNNIIWKKILHVDIYDSQIPLAKLLNRMRQ